MTKEHLEKAEILGALMRADIEVGLAKQRWRDENKIVARTLRDKRKQAGLSLREVARRMGFTPPYVSDVELGRRGVTIRFADEYMEAVQK